MSNQIIDPGRWVGEEGDPDTQEVTRRRVLAYLVAAPVLTIAVKVVDSVVGADPAGATPGLPDIFDLTDAITLAALPTMGLLVVEITPQNRVIVRLPREEVGQGLTTSFAQIVADELGARLSDTEVVLEDARPELLFNQLTGGSNSIHALYGPMRDAAAAARARLITAAAQQWGVPAGSLAAANTAVTGSGRSATFGELTTAAAGVLIPAVPATRKDPSQFTLIGQPTNRVDARDVVTGRVKYANDLDVPGAKPTVVARPPTIKGTVAAVANEAAVRAMPGVLGVARVPSGVAVMAETFDQALKARDALVITWNPGPLAGLSDPQIRNQLQAGALPFVVPPLGVLAIDRSFDFAFLPHAPLETLNCVADVRADRAEIWVPSKAPIAAAAKVAEAVGLPASAVTLHVIRAGGSFGRRLFPDAAVDAAQCSEALGRPVKLLYTRADDMHHGRMRPASHHKIRATHLLGNVLAFEHRMAAIELDLGHGLGDALTAVGFDLLKFGGGKTVHQLTQKVPYNFGVETQLLNDVFLPFPTSPWRSIYSGQAATANEIMVDEIARGLRKDPVAFRRQTLTLGRARAVLDKVASAGQWGRAMPAGTAQGVAMWEEYKGVVAFLAEIDCRDRAKPRVTKGVCAVDVGRAVNPTGLAAQMQGAFTDGISATLQAGVHIDNGAVRESSYTDFRYARMRHSALEVAVHVMPPTGEPGGSGELGYPAAAAAVANAYARATGTLPTSFPIAG